MKQVLLVGRESVTLGPEEQGQMGLSKQVQAAAEEAIRLIELLVV